MNLLNQICLFIALLALTTSTPIINALRDNGNNRIPKLIEAVKNLIYFWVIFLITQDYRLVIGLLLVYFIVRISIGGPIYSWVRNVKEPKVTATLDNLWVIGFRILLLGFGLGLFFIGLFS